MPDARPLVAKIQVEHTGASSGAVKKAPEGSSTGSGKKLVAGVEDGVEQSKKSNLFLEKLHKVSRFQLLRFLGVNIALTALVKQSAIWTNTLGALFQMFGALIDMILAPFMPFIVKFLRDFAKNLPKIAERITDGILGFIDWVRAIYDKLVSMAPWLQNLFDSLGAIIKYSIITLLVARIFGLQGVLVGGIIKLSGLLLWGFGKLLGLLGVNKLFKFLGNLFGKTSATKYIQAAVVYLNSAKIMAGYGLTGVPDKLAKGLGVGSAIGVGALTAVAAGITYGSMKGTEKLGSIYTSRRDMLELTINMHRTDMNNNQVDDALELRQKLLRQSKYPLSGLNPTHPMDAYGTKEAAHYSLGMDVLSQLGN